MSFRILFADDSMTAQNMGKKILTDAGYEVVAVSNGAAAVKKIAEQKPDIIILDIYMPGYSGLEVCDKVRASIDTLKTPVLLTVGKMEPYKPEDANRVRADGVIIKPFEASDLLAVIKKLEERVVPKTIALAQDTVLLERPPEFAEFEPTPINEVEMQPAATSVQATVDVPDNMATTAAFSDLLGVDSTYSLDPLPVPKPPSSAESRISSEPPVELAPPPAPVEEPASARAEESVAEAWPPEPKPVVAAEFGVSPEPPVESAPAPAPMVESASARAKESVAEAWPPEPKPEVAAEFGVSPKPPVESVPSPAPIVEPVLAKSEEAATAGWTSPSSNGEFVGVVETGFALPEPHRTAAHQEPEPVAISQETPTETESKKVAEPEPTETQELLVNEVEAHSFIDPGLAIDAGGFDALPAKETEFVPSAPVIAGSDAPPVDAEIAKLSLENEFKETDAGPQPVACEDDFEARVAAAMSIYDEPAEAKVDTEPPLPPWEHPAPHETVSEPPSAFSDEPASFEYAPPVNASKSVEVAEVAVASVRHFQEPPISPGPMLVTTEATQVIPVYLEPPVEPKRGEATAAPQTHAKVPEEASQAVGQSIEARIEAVLPAVTAAASANVGADTQMITAVVDRILERLKPQMIEEISRELKSKKQ